MMEVRENIRSLIILAFAFHLTHSNFGWGADPGDTDVFDNEAYACAYPSERDKQSAFDYKVREPDEPPKTNYPGVGGGHDYTDPANVACCPKPPEKVFITGIEIRSSGEGGQTAKSVTPVSPKTTKPMIGFGDTVISNTCGPNRGTPVRGFKVTCTLNNPAAGGIFTLVLNLVGTPESVSEMAGDLIELYMSAGGTEMLKTLASYAVARRQEISVGVSGSTFLKYVARHGALRTSAFLGSTGWVVLPGLALISGSVYQNLIESTEDTVRRHKEKMKRCFPGMYPEKVMASCSVTADDHEAPTPSPPPNPICSQKYSFYTDKPTADTSLFRCNQCCLDPKQSDMDTRVCDNLCGQAYDSMQKKRTFDLTYLGSSCKKQLTYFSFQSTQTQCETCCDKAASEKYKTNDLDKICSNKCQQ